MACVRCVAALGCALAATAAGARADDLPARVDVRAENVAFYPYSNAMLLAAAGRVTVRAGTRTIVADALRYDLDSNRISAAGNVRVSGPRGEIAADAYVVELASGRAELLRLEPLPATYALRGDDLATAVEGPAPAGTFDALDLDGQRPYIRSHHAIVAPSAAVRMSPAEFPTGAGPALTLPTYLYTLVRNAYISQSAGPGASFDQPYNIFGTRNSLTAGHLRYGAQDGVTLGLDEKLVEGNRAYAVVSVLPLRGRRFDLNAFQQIRPGLQQSFSATRTFAPFPITLAQYRLQNTGRAFSQTLVAGTFNTTNFAELDLATLAHDVGRFFSYQLRAGYGYDHSLFNYPYANDFRFSAGGYAATPSVRLLGTSLDARYDYALTSYDVPHETANGTVTFTAGRPLARGLDLYGSVAFAQVANRYRDAAVAMRALGLPDPRAPYFAPDGTLFPGYFAYAGASTYRTYSLQTRLHGRGDDNLLVTLTHARDFPQFHGYGRPPLTASVDLTRRLTPTIRIELGRSYTFGWNGRYLSPQYTFGISP